jgi:hypothetical protein
MPMSTADVDSPNNLMFLEENPPKDPEHGIQIFLVVQEGAICSRLFF